MKFIKLILIYIFTNSFIFSESLYTEQDLTKLKIDLAKNYSRGYKKSFKESKLKIRHKDNESPSFKFYIETLENIKPEDIKIDKKLYEYVIIISPKSGHSIGDVVEKKKKNLFLIYQVKILQVMKEKIGLSIF